MNDLLQRHSTGNVTLTEIEQGIKEARRLRSEELNRLGGAFIALIRNGVFRLKQTMARTGRFLVKALEHRMEVMASRLQRAKVHYD